MEATRRGPRLVVVLPLGVMLAAALAGAIAWLLAGSGFVATAAAAIAAAGATALLLRPVTRSIRRAAGLASGRDTLPQADATGGYSELKELDRALAQIAESFARTASASSQDRAQLLAALNSSADAVVGVDNAGNICFTNLAAEKLFLRSQGEMLGRSFALMLPTPEPIEALRASLASGRPEIRAIERPNKQFLQVSATPVSEGGDWAALVVFHDLTDVNRAERMRRDFVANVSHELRTPLASIRAVLETLESGAMSDPVASRDFISRAQTEVDRLTEMVAELLELSRIESGEFPITRAPVSIGRAVSDAVERLQSQADRMGVHLSAEVPPDLPLVLGDSERLERAVVNLVHNALKFTQSGGQVTVTAGPRDGSVMVEVSDNGAGIDERDLPRIFERFYKSDNSRRTDGSGLGLALVKHTAEAHGGSVSVASAVGRGSTFTLTLPAMEMDSASNDLEASSSRRES